MPKDRESPLSAVVTGASSGIGAATSRQLAAAGFHVVAAARRSDRLAELARTCQSPRIPGRVLPFTADVTDVGSLESLAAAVDTCDVLVCNAGGALGLDPVVSGSDEQWATMWQTNVLGVARTVRAHLPALRRASNPTVVVVTSVAGHQVYPNGGGYTSANHAAAAVTDTLRLELLGEVRIIEIAPGLVDTEFSLVRFGGDQQRADSTYEGMTPLTADDVADAIVWAVTRPPHVVPARIDLFPLAQASARDVRR